jgi:hypothetical protein
MALPTLDLEEQALLLPIEERALLAEKLLMSLNFPVDPDVEAAWIEEAEKRRLAVLSGAYQTIPLEEAIAKIRSRKKS